MTFLKKVTEHICNKYSEDLANICIVLPNRRAGLYIKKYISQKMQKVIWAPSVFSVEDFACHITGIKVADPVNLIFDFYSIYKNKEGEKAQPFNEFINWASVLLNDYNDADLNLADTEGLFKYLNETKAMSLWNLEGEPLTDHEKFYLKFYNSLSNYYKDFVELLLKKNTAYPGLINKKAAGNIDEYANTTNYKCVIFAGFNALTASEEKIIKSLLKAGKAEIFWDAEKYYVDNEIQEAGLFIRKYRKEWDLKEFNWLEDNLGKGEKNITITGVPLKIGQTELAGQILSEIDEKIANSENTALVLADENLLIPMLYAIPENIKHINITMGYPLTNSSVYNLFTNLFLLHENSLKYSSNIVVKFYFKDIINLLNSSILRMFEINDKNRSCVFKLQEYIKKSNRIFLTYDEICLHLKDTPILPFFEPVENNSVALLNKFTTLTTIIKDTLILNKKEGLKYSEMDMEYLFNFAVIVAQTRNLLTTYNFVNDIKTLRKIIKSLVETSSIPFYGEPLKGLQIMGMLETRVLDFENIIILSANEGILPAGKFQSTFIPFDIRKDMGLSTYKHKEAIFAYHFYRLIQRAKNIHIIYNTQTDDFGSGEKSRFITQIVEELKRYNPEINIKQKLLISDLPQTNTDDLISINKSPEIIEALVKHAEQGYSPSALNTYISCPLRFYFRYVEGIKETDDVDETIDAATLGSVVHYVLQNLYFSFKEKKLLPTDIKQMFPKVESLIKQGFSEYYSKGDVNFGKNLLISKVAEKFINNYLNYEIKFIEELNRSNETLTIMHLEESFETDILLPIDDAKIKVKIKGFIDRIDRAGSTIRIIDYKTGNVKKDELTIKTYEQLISESKLAKSLQLLTYAYLFNKNTNTLNLSTGIFTFRSLSKGFCSVTCPDTKSDIIDIANLQEVENALLKIISSIFDKNIPFTQTADTKICKNCPFTEICNK